MLTPNLRVRPIAEDPIAKDCESQRGWMIPRKQCLSDIAGQMHKCTQRDLHRFKPDKTPAQGREEDIRSQPYARSICIRYLMEKGKPVTMENHWAGLMPSS